MQLNKCVTELFEETQPKTTGLIWIDTNMPISELQEGMIKFNEEGRDLSIYLEGQWMAVANPFDLIPTIENIRDYEDEGEEGDIVFCRANEQKYIKFDGYWMVKLDSLEEEQWD